MPENSLKNNLTSTENGVTSLNRYRQKKDKSKYNKPHCIIPVDDLHWVINQTKTIQTLWNECWTCDQYGSRWMKLTTSLGDKAFRLARQLLYKAGLFEFKRETCIEDSRKTCCWLVINLHGARRIKQFWLNDNQPSPVEKTEVILDPISGTNEPNNSINFPNDGQKIPDILPETPDNSSISAPLSSSSVTSQELLKEVPEKEEGITCKLFERVRKYASEKTAQKLKSVLSRCLKNFHGESKEDYYKYFFTSRYNWRIDDERLKRILQLNQHCQTALLQQFQYTYGIDAMSAPRTFDKAINLVINDSDRITELISRQSEYFERVFNRREQILGNNPIGVNSYV